LGEYTQVIQTEIDRVDRLVEQLLAYARPFPLQRAPVAIGDVIARTVTLTRAYAAQNRVELTVAIDADLPLVNGDAELLHQALVNVLLNGMHATSPGGSISVKAATNGAGSGTPAMITLTIHDTGQGIAPTDLPHIFDPFYTTRADGTGLGLSIVQQIVQEHGGTIEVQSQIARGTSFILHLPVLQR
jgi:two-component system, NtrC family, sensor histidine kinase HydH